MLFPETQRVVYGRKVLDEVICQLRFPPILRIGVESPAGFQERIRKSYPNYAQDSDSPEMPIQISAMLEQLQVPNPFGAGSQLRHRFSKRDDKRSLVITSEFLAISDKDYERWEKFRSELKLVESEFRSEYQPDGYTRVGLRYRDQITRSELQLDDIGWDELLNSELMGMLANKQLASVIRQDRTDVELDIPEVEGGRLHLRLGLAPRQGSQEMSYTVDADLYTNTRCEPDDALRILDSFHATAGNFFRWAIRERLRDALEPRPLENGQ
jgi:uncharacterized protein (TIGR04255 family)